jgi:hypothetical protein
MSDNRSDGAAPRPLRGKSDNRLHELAVESNTDFQSKAAARFELQCREREYAEQQEQSRRTFETGLVDKQVFAATDVATATRRAFWAAVFAATGAVVQAGAAVWLIVSATGCH